VLKKARRLAEFDSNFTALAEGNAMGITTISYNFGVSRCVCSAYIVSTVSIHFFIDNELIVKRY
jgi:hypothetical protein